MNAFSEPVRQDIDPRQWSAHRFGLTLEGWQRLHGKGVWITGAGTGYGRSLAVACAAAGCRVFLTGRRREQLAASLAEMESLGIAAANCHSVDIDITDEGAVVAASRQIEREGGLTALINNAALPQKRVSPCPLQQAPTDDFNRLLQTNVVAPWLLTRTAFPSMARRREARVLFISSLAGWAFTPGVGHYNVSKAALNNLAASLAAEYAAAHPDLDVQMNVLAAGEARTEMNQGSDVSPYSICAMALLLLSQPPGGPNGRFFHQDGRHLSFCTAAPYDRPLTS